MYNATVNASNHASLNETPDTGQSSDLDIIHQLGSETITGAWALTSSDETSNASNLTPSTFDLDVTVVGTSAYRPYMRAACVASDSTKQYSLQFDIVVNSGNAVLKRIYNGTNYDPDITLTTGHHSIDIARGNDAYASVILYFDGTQLFDISVTNISIKEVTTTDSYLNYFDVATKSRVTIDKSSAPSTTHTMNTSFSGYFTSNIEVTALDNTYIEQNPESLAETWFETKVHSELSFTKANMIDMYFAAGGQQSLEKIYNSKDNSFSTITAYTLACVTNHENVDYGLSKLKLVRDANGTPTGMQADGFTSWEDDGRTAVTGWTITAPFTVTEVDDVYTYTYLSNGNRYKNNSPDGTYPVPTGIWTLDHTRFDGTAGVTKRGNTKMVNSLQIP